MSKKTSVSVGNVKVYDTPDVHIMSFDTNLGYRVIAKTTKKFKQSLKTKIIEYCKQRRK